MRAFAAGCLAVFTFDALVIAHATGVLIFAAALIGCALLVGGVEQLRKGRQ